MDFFEFASEYDEAATPRPAPASSSAPRRPTSPATTSGSAARQTPAATRSAPQAQAAQRPSPSRKKSSGFDFAGLARNLQQGLDFVRTGVNVAQQFKRPSPQAAPPPSGAAQPAPVDAPAAGGAAPAPGEYPGAAAPPVPGDTGSPLDQFAAVLQSLQQQPSPAAAPAGVVSPAMPAQAGPQRADGLALLRLILGNPQFQQVLQSAATVGAAAAPRTVELPVPVPTAPQHTQLLAVPLGAVLNAVEVLAGESMSELNETTREDEPEVPEYLVDEQGEFVVDPAIPEARAARVVDIFLRSAEAQRYGPMKSTRRFSEADDELSESDAWARDAGFGM